MADWSFLIPLGLLEGVGGKMLYDAVTKRRAPYWNGWAKTYYIERESHPVGYWLVVALIATWMAVVLVAFWTEARP